MAYLPQQNTFVQYLADGITSSYVVPFYTPLEPDGTPNFDVFTQLSTAQPVPADDLNEWNVDYTYTPNIDPITGGTLNFLPGHIPPSGYVVTIVRDVQASLDVEFSQAQTFSGYTLDAALDKLLLISQQNKSYAFERNLSYIVNAYIPESEVAANVQIPVLGDQQVWMGSNGGVIAATLEQPADVSTLRSELANEAPVTNGASLVGYYDSVNSNPTTVDDQLTLLTNAIVAPFPTGSIIDFAGTSAPAGFIVCNGNSYPTSTYPDLFAVIGYTWGGSGGNFNVPNLSGRVTAGSGGTLPPLTNTVGSVGGSATHSIAVNELPAHKHGFSYSAPRNGALLQGGSNNTYANSPGNNTGTTDNNSTTHTAMTIVQPTAIVLKCIKI